MRWHTQIGTFIMHLGFNYYFVCLHFRCYPPSWSPFHESPNSISIPMPFASKRVVHHSHTHSCLTHLVILLLWGIKPPQDQAPPLPLMLDEAVLCYTCSGSQNALSNVTHPKQVMMLGVPALWLMKMQFKCTHEETTEEPKQTAS